MENRLTNGLIAGVAGGIAMNVFSLIDYHILHFTTFRFLDWSAVMLYGERTQSVWGNVFALFAQLIFTSFLGLVFAYIVLIFEDRSYFFKGWYYGIICWFTIYGIDILLKLHDLNKISVQTAISNFIGSSIFGITLGYALWRLDLQEITEDNKGHNKTRLRYNIVPNPVRKTKAKVKKK